jgi:lysophospholipase L1-like esterase
MRTGAIAQPIMTLGGVLAAQILHAAFRTDLPSHTNQDPSGDFGDISLPTLRIAFLGDSSVTAPGVDPLDACWARQLVFHLTDRFHVQARSVAVGGSKVRDVLASQIDAAIAVAPDIAYVSVGSNDALRGTPITRFEREYREMAGILHEAVPAVGLSGVGDLGSIPRLPEFARGVARIRARSVNNAIARVGADLPRAVKSNPWGIMWDTFYRDAEMFAGDQFHASAKGHLVFAEVARPMADRLVDVWDAERGDLRPITPSGRGSA